MSEQAFTFFSRHAFKRIAERSRLRPSDVAKILDNGGAIDTGSKPGFNRHHWLFYSAADDCCFVAIQDMSIGTVVTVLPLDYHATLAWPITEDDCQRARALAATMDAQAPPASQRPQAGRIFFSVVYLDASGRSKAKALPSLLLPPFNSNISQLLSNQELTQTIEAAALAKGIKVEQILHITIRAGRKGTPFTIDLANEEKIYRIRAALFAPPESILP